MTTERIRASGIDNYGQAPFDDTGVKRWDFIAALISCYGLRRGAEIGVADGVFTRGILAAVPDSIVHAVDHWEPRSRREGYTSVDPSVATHPNTIEDYGTWDRDWQLERVSALAWEYPRRCIICMATSMDAAAMFARERIMLDWVFIDGSHRYDDVLADIRAWTPLVRSGGIVAGHDRTIRDVARALRETGPCFAGPDDCWWRLQP